MTRKSYILQLSALAGILLAGLVGCAPGVSGNAPRSFLQATLDTLALDDASAAPSPSQWPLEKYGVARVSRQDPFRDDEPGRLPSPKVQTKPEAEPIPRPLGAEGNAEGVDFGTALSLAVGRNPRVGLAQARIEEAFARVSAANSLWLPSIRAGANWHKHEGRIQDVAGTIIETSRGSLYGGLGANAVGAGSPATPGVYANFRLADAVFQPRIEKQSLAARQHAADAVTQDLMLSVALAYLDLLEAVQARAIADETLANAQALADLTAEFAKAGQGTEADADRARSELAVRQTNVARADEAIAVARARLAELLARDPTTPFMPREPAMAPIELVPLSNSAPELVALGLSNRPELAESRHLVEEAVERLRRERMAPLLPSLLLGASQGINGGGLGSDLSRFGDRFDLDAGAYWELRNLGFGERAARRGARARIDQAQFEEMRSLDRVAREVVEAHAQSTQRHKQIATAEQGIIAARDSYRRNIERIREGQGLPLEALQSIQALDQARLEYLRAVTSYNQAQFSLIRALGWPE